MSRAGLFFKKQLWIWPIVAIVLLSAAGFYIRSSIESTIKGNLTSGLQSFVTIESSMLENYFKVQQSNATTLANDAQVRQLAYQLLGVAKTESGGDESAGSAAEVQQRLIQELAPAMASLDYDHFFIADKNKTIVAATNAALVGQDDIIEYDDFLERTLDGETVVCPPFPSVVLMKTPSGKTRMGQPVMYVSAPLRDNTFSVIGVLALQIQPSREFTRILQLGRVGASGETYAFNARGLMVSQSRFDEDMILLGLLPDKEDSFSILNVMIRDPGGDMTQGYRPGVRRAKLPLTRMAEDAIAGNSNVDVEGYRDYRGVPVVGAWTWMPKYKIGVATEVDVAQAFRPLVVLHRVFWSLYALLIAAAVAIFVFTLIVARARREAQKAAVEAQQLGQYTLDEKLGAGAMGIVYKGHHAMMRRPTAIKMLDIDKVNEASIARFEREVKITCQLTHPNTIAIFDYGRTPEGVFYYAMEYIEGLDLQTLVSLYGPQPQNRVIHLMLQICGSLFEAHSLGLVHRDIKPANTMICRRGCEPDVIKVLDFGLVKAIEDEKQGSRASGLTGTPLYMSPEAIQSPLSIDGRSDIYAVGAVGYYLLTGETVFDADSVVDLCQKQIDEVPISPSKRTSNPVSDQLEYAIMACLEKSRAKRPQTARDLAQLLQKCPEAHTWTTEDGEAWWSRHSRGERKPPESTQPNTKAKTSVTLDQTIDS